ncbi:MAG TPA: hypothetical protein VF435_15625 [Pyrinomonadaceae bacterium]
MRRNSKSRIRRYRKFAWVFGTGAIIIALLYWEQAAMLYVLSTLAICALLVVVMFANLEGRDKELHQGLRKLMLGMPNQLALPHQRKT